MTMESWFICLQLMAAPTPPTYPTIKTLYPPSTTTATTTTTTTTDVTKIALTLTFTNINYHTDMATTTTTKFKRAAKKIQNRVLKYVGSMVGGFKYYIIRQLDKGSTISTGDVH